MKEMKTLTWGGTTYEVVDAKARTDVASLEAGTKRDCAPPVTETAAGASIRLTDSTDRPLRNLKLFGRTNQEVTSGKNLFDVTAALSNQKLGTTVSNYYTAYGNGVQISANSYENGRSYMYLNLDAGTYNISANVNVTGGWNCSVKNYDTDTELVNQTTSVAGAISYSFTVDVAALIGFCFISTESGGPTTYVTNIQLELGTEATAYEHYSGGVASPSPSWPQELTSVENPTVEIYGGNLANLPDMDEYTTNGITWLYKDGAIYANGTAVAQSYVPPSTCPLSLIPGIYTLSGGADNIMVIVSRTRGSTKDYFTSRDGGYITFDVEENDILYLYAQVANGKTVVSALIYPMLNAGTGPLAHEAYVDVQTLAPTRTLPGIPVTSGGNYTDANGRQWVCDEIDFERGVYVQRCFRETLAFTFQEDLNRYSATLSNTANSAYAIVQGIPVLSSTLPFNPACGSGTPMINGIRVAASSPKYAIAYYNGEVIESADVIYPLAIPIETPLTEEELKSYSILYANGPSTTILNDHGVYMEVEYSKDLRSYIREIVYGDAYDRAEDVITQDKIQLAVDNWLNAHFSSAEGESF